MSNWENRPLRYSQEHYASMDAWVLIDIIYLMQEHVSKENLQVDINDFITSKGD